MCLAKQTMRNSNTVVNSQADDVLLLESEAMEKGDTEGSEAALAWLQS